MKKALFILTILIGAFGIIQFSNASQSYDQPQQTATTSAFSPWGSLTYHQTFGQGVDGFTIDLLDLRAYVTATGTLTVNIWYSTSSALFTCIGQTGTGCYQLADSNTSGYIDVLGNTYIVLNWDNPPVLSDDYYYGFSFWTLDLEFALYGNSTDTYPNGHCGYQFGGWNACGVDDIYFHIQDQDFSENFNRFGFFYEDTGFSTMYPVGCEYNEVASTSATEMSFPVYFQFTNATDSNTVFNELTAYFYDIEGNSTSSLLYSGDIEPGDAVSVYETINLPIDDYRFELEATGYNISNGEYVVITSGGTDDSGNTCNCTSVGVGGVTNNSTCNWGNTGYLACQNYLENCIGTSTSWTDTIMCRIEALAVGLICPSNESFGKAKGILTDVKARFPINYINAARNSLTGLASSTTATSSATTSYITGNLGDFSSGFKEVDFFSSLRQVIGYLLILGTVFFAIRYTTQHILR